MIKIDIYFLAALKCLFVAARGFIKPDRFANEYVASRWQHRHLHNMTENLIKDALYKLRQADIIQAHYKKSTSYEIGQIAASIMTHWRHMVEIYRYYSNAKDFKNSAHNITQIMNAYAVMQSDYSEALQETTLFHRHLYKSRLKQRAERILARKLGRKYRMSSNLILSMIKEGVDVEKELKATDNRLIRRMVMSTLHRNDTLFDTDSLEDEAFSRKMKTIAKAIETGDYDYLGFPKEQSFNEWVKKDAKNTQEAEYKKSLRYKKWAEKWDGFNPDIEGIKIPDKIASMGLKNASDFFLTEL